MSSTSRRASQTRSSPASNRYIRGEDVSAAAMGVDRFDVDADVNEADAATSTQSGLQVDMGSIRHFSGRGLTQVRFRYRGQTRRFPDVRRMSGLPPNRRHFRARLARGVRAISHLPLPLSVCRIVAVVTISRWT